MRYFTKITNLSFIHLPCRPVVMLSSCPFVRCSVFPVAGLSSCPFVLLSYCPIVSLSDCPIVWMSGYLDLWLSCCPFVPLFRCLVVPLSLCPVTFGKNHNSTQVKCNSWMLFNNEWYMSDHVTEVVTMDKKYPLLKLNRLHGNFCLGHIWTKTWLNTGGAWFNNAF